LVQPEVYSVATIHNIQEMLRFSLYKESKYRKLYLSYFSTTEKKMFLWLHQNMYIAICCVLSTTHYVVYML